MSREEFTSHVVITRLGRVSESTEKPEDWAVTYREGHYEDMGATNWTSYVVFNPNVPMKDIRVALETARITRGCKPEVLLLAERTARQERYSSCEEYFKLQRELESS